MRLLQIFTKHDTLIRMVPLATPESIGKLEFLEISRKFSQFSWKSRPSSKIEGRVWYRWIENFKAHLPVYRGAGFAQWELHWELNIEIFDSRRPYGKVPSELVGTLGSVPK